jgi:hypothetical protein
VKKVIIDIPGYQVLELDTLLVDYNGTLAVDGEIRAGVKERINQLAKRLSVYVLTADTHGTARQKCEGLKAEVYTFPEGSALEAKHQILKKLGEQHCVCIGNGRNDVKMLRDAMLSIAVMDREGVYAGLMKEADLCVNSIEDGLDLLLYPKRLIAGLRG